MTRWIIVIILFIVIVVGAVTLLLIPSPRGAEAPDTDTATSTATTQVSSSSTSLDDLLKVTAPLSDAKITSPLKVEGQARGSFYFEATFPVELLDASGNTIAQNPAQAQGDWETTDYVPFTATLTFPPQSTGSKGTLVLKNDNPSGNPANQKELDIPITF